MDDTYSGERMPDLEFYKVPKYSVWVESFKVFLMFSIPLLIIIYAGYDQAGGTYRTLWFSLCLSLCPILATVVRRTCHSMLLFLAAHAVMAGLVWLAPNMILKVLTILFLLALTVYGLVRVMSREPEREMSILTFYLAVLVMLVVYILMIVRGHLEYEWSLILQGVIYAIAYLVYDHHTAVLDSLKAIDKQGTMSTRRVIRFNGSVFGAYMVLGILLMIVAYFAGLGGLVSKIAYILLSIVRKIVGFFSKDETVVVEEDEGTGTVSEGGDDGLTGFETPRESPFWQFMQKVLVVVFVLAVAYFLVILLIRFIKSFHGSSNYHEADYDEYKSFFSKVKAPKEKRERLSLFDRSPENRIRRAYFRKVRRHIDKDVLRSDTPEQVAGKLQDVGELVTQYEQVRYGSLKIDP